MKTEPVDAARRIKHELPSTVILMVSQFDFAPFAREDPDAAPQTTFAFSVNDLDQICGSFTDLVGNTHGFVRDPGDGSFKTIQFPLADNSSVNQINNHGTMAGEYNLRLGHGFLTYDSNFQSFDYPDSDFSGLRAVNNRGQVGGYFVVSGKFQAYLATPREE